MGEALRRANNFIWGAVVVLAILVPSFRNIDYKDHVVSTGFFLLLIFQLIRWLGSEKIRASKLEVVLLLYVGWTLLSVFWAPMPSASWQFLGRFLPWVGIYILVRQEKLGETPGARMVCWTAGVWIVLLYGFLQKAGFDFISYFGPNTLSEGLFSTFGEPNVYAAFLTLSWPIIIFAPLDRKKAQREAFLRVFLAFLVVLNLIFTRSTAGLAAFGVQFILLVLLMGTRAFKEPKWRLGMAAFAILVATAAIFQAPNFNRMTGRADVWKNSARMAMEHPLMGWGVNQFSLHYGSVAQGDSAQTQGSNGALHAKNLLLETWVELGLVGVILVSVFWAWPLLKTLKGIFEERKLGNPVPPSVLGLVLGIMGVGVTNLLDTTCRQSGVGFFLWLSLALLANQAWAASERQWPKRAVTAGAALLAVPALLGLGLNLKCVYLEFFNRPRQDFLKNVSPDLAGNEKQLLNAVKKEPENAGRYHELGNVYAKAGKVDEAQKAYEKELELDPDSAGAYLNLGNIYFLKADKDEVYLAKALVCYKKSAELDPKSVEAHFNLAYALFVTQDKRGALKHVDEVLRLDPANPWAMELKRQIVP